MVRAFVTGGSGFVGANLVAGLNDHGIEVKVLMRESSSTKALAGLQYHQISGDILDPVETLADAMNDNDWVFHVAAVSDYWRQDHEKMYRVNIEGTRNVLAAAKMAGVQRFVFTSSISTMGTSSGEEPINESSPFDLEPRQFPYAHSKYLAELEVQKSVVDGLPAVIVNPSICLGPRDVHMNSGSIVIEAARGLARVIPPGGTNYVAVEDVVSGHIAAAEKGRIGERYILGGVNITHAKAVEIVCDVVGRPPPKVKLPRWFLPPLATAVRAARAIFGNRIPFDATQVRLVGLELYASNEKAVSELGLPITPFRTAVQNTYDWYNKNGYLPRSI